MTIRPAGMTGRQAAPGLLAATAVPAWAQEGTEDCAEGPAFQKEIVEAYELIGKAIPK